MTSRTSLPSEPKPLPERVLIEEARLITGLPIRTLQQMSIRGEIPSAAKLGRRWTYDRVRLRAWVESKATPGGTGLDAAPAGVETTRERLKRIIAERLKGASNE